MPSTPSEPSGDLSECPNFLVLLISIIGAIVYMKCVIVHCLILSVVYKANYFTFHSVSWWFLTDVHFSDPTSTKGTCLSVCGVEGVHDLIHHSAYQNITWRNTETLICPILFWPMAAAHRALVRYFGNSSLSELLQCHGVCFCTIVTSCLVSRSTTFLYNYHQRDKGLCLRSMALGWLCNSSNERTLFSTVCEKHSTAYPDPNCLGICVSGASSNESWGKGLKTGFQRHQPNSLELCNCT